jgi:alanyl-tRNA synthetase
MISSGTKQNYQVPEGFVKNKEFYQLILDITPFYAESGGQVGIQAPYILMMRIIDVTNTKRKTTLSFILPISCQRP